jgi:uncharacterized protein (DUF2336 family)
MNGASETPLSVLAQLRPQPAPALADLVHLAQNPSADARQRLLLGVLSLCEAQPEAKASSDALAEIFLTVAGQIERDVRLILAKRLAEAEWAPRALVNILVLDEIEIARPLLASSPVLQDDDMMKVLLEATLEHQIEVARRPNLSGRLADAIIDKGQPATLMALASNATAEVGDDGLRRLVEHSRRIAALRLPLTRHPGLTENLAEQMFQWVGTALRQAIAARFSIDEVRLAAMVEQATLQAMRPDDDSTPAFEPGRDEMDRRLIAKLQAAGQLKPGYLIRAVREKRLGLFVHGLAALSGLAVVQIRKAMDADSSEALCHACTVVEIDRAVFPLILADVRILNGGLPGQAAKPVFQADPMSPGAAARAFRALIPG